LSAICESRKGCLGGPFPCPLFAYAWPSASDCCVNVCEVPKKRDRRDSPMIEFGHLTHVGLRRELNEDSYYGDRSLGLWLVADGMGGHEYGEVASALARETIVRETRDGTALVQAIRVADEEIIRISRQ